MTKFASEVVDCRRRRPAPIEGKLSYNGKSALDDTNPTIFTVLVGTFKKAWTRSMKVVSVLLVKN